MDQESVTQQESRRREQWSLRYVVFIVEVIVESQTWPITRLKWHSLLISVQQTSLNFRYVFSFIL